MAAEMLEEAGIGLVNLSPPKAPLSP